MPTPIPLPSAGAPHLRLASRTLGCFALCVFLAQPLYAGTVYFSEDFEGANAVAPKQWWAPANEGGTARLTEERAFSGKRSALIEAGAGYFEILLPKPLKWDRSDPAGIGNKPLYLSARVFAVSGGADVRIGLRASIVPKHHPGSEGAPFCSEREGNVLGRTNQWLLLCLDVGKALRDNEERGHLNQDHVVFQSVSLIVFSGGKFYVDDLRLSTEPPEGCSSTPALPAVDAAAYYRADPKLDNVIVHGVYGGVGSVLGDVQLHPWVVRDLKRHYLNLAMGFDYRVTSSERVLHAVGQVLDQAAHYDMPVMLMSYLGDKYTSEVGGWSEDRLRQGMQRIVQRFKDKNHLFGWYLEEESGPERTARYLQQKRWVEEADPNHSVLTTFGAGPGVQAMGPAHALIMTDSYPIMGPNSNPWYVTRYLGRDVPRFKQPYVLVDQVFAGESYTVPTLGQWRLMVYGALAEGVKGFCHFAYAFRPLYRERTEQPLQDGLTDPYGTPGAIYREIERHLGPDLFSFGELLRTCHPAAVPPELRLTCVKVEDALEREIPAIALRRLVDEQNRYEIIALYSNDPDQRQSGELSMTASWLADRVVIDLNAHSRDILRATPILVGRERLRVTLAPGDARFFAVVARSHAAELVRRMQARRFEAMRKMVEFDSRWLATVGVGQPDSHERWADLQRMCDEDRPAVALRQLMRIEQQNRGLIRHSSLSVVLRRLDAIRAHLSDAHGAMAKWAVFKKGQPFPPDVEPGKTYCDVQEKLSELYVGFSDLAYLHPPDGLVKPVTRLAKLCRMQADDLRAASRQGVPAKACRVPAAMIAQLDKDLGGLGWTRPPTAQELSDPAAQSAVNP